MKYNISKELFEAIYNCNISTDKDMHKQFKLLQDSEQKQNAFFFECKKWLEDIAWEDVIIYKNQVMFIDNLYAEGGIYIHKCFEHKSIKQALFDTCQWLVDTRVEYEG